MKYNIKAKLLAFLGWLMPSDQQLAAINTKDTNLEIAKEQKEYITLPVHKVKNDDYGRVVAVFSMGIWQRLTVLFTGKIYVNMLTFNNPLQPLSIYTFNPVPSFYLPLDVVSFEMKGVEKRSRLKIGQTVHVHGLQGQIKAFKGYDELLVKMKEGNDLKVSKANKNLTFYVQDLERNEIK